MRVTSLALPAALLASSVQKSESGLGPIDHLRNVYPSNDGDRPRVHAANAHKNNATLVYFEARTGPLLNAHVIDYRDRYSYTFGKRITQPSAYVTVRGFKEDLGPLPVEFEGVRLADSTFYEKIEGNHTQLFDCNQNAKDGRVCNTKVDDGKIRDLSKNPISGIPSEYEYLYGGSFEVEQTCKSREGHDSHFGSTIYHPINCHWDDRCSIQHDNRTCTLYVYTEGKYTLELDIKDHNSPGVSDKQSKIDKTRTLTNYHLFGGDLWEKLPGQKMKLVSRDYGIENYCQDNPETHSGLAKLCKEIRTDERRSDLKWIIPVSLFGGLVVAAAAGIAVMAIRDACQRGAANDLLSCITEAGGVAVGGIANGCQKSYDCMRDTAGKAGTTIKNTGSAIKNSVVGCMTATIATVTAFTAFGGSGSDQQTSGGGEPVQPSKPEVPPKKPDVDIETGNIDDPVEPIKPTPSAPIEENEITVEAEIPVAIEDEVYFTPGTAKEIYHDAANADQASDVSENSQEDNQNKGWGWFTG